MENVHFQSGGGIEPTGSELGSSLRTFAYRSPFGLIESMNMLRQNRRIKKGCCQEGRKRPSYVFERLYTAQLSRWVSQEIARLIRANPVSGVLGKHFSKGPIESLYVLPRAR